MCTQGWHAHLGIDQLDELVKVLEPHVGILVLEVRTHGHHSVVGAVELALQTEWGCPQARVSWPPCAQLFLGIYVVSCGCTVAWGEGCAEVCHMGTQGHE